MSSEGLPDAATRPPETEALTGRAIALRWSQWLLLGAVAGTLLRASYAAACSCPVPEWEMELTSVESTDQDVDHSTLWPQEATIWGGPTSFMFRPPNIMPTPAPASVHCDFWEGERR